VTIGDLGDLPTQPPNGSTRTDKVGNHPRRGLIVSLAPGRVCRIQGREQCLQAQRNRKVRRNTPRRYIGRATQLNRRKLDWNTLQTRRGGNNARNAVQLRLLTIEQYSVFTDESKALDDSCRESRIVGQHASSLCNH
jgi:hypothetical protein